VNRAVLLSKLCTTCGARYAADALFCPSDGTPLSSNAAAGAANAGGPDAPDPYLGREISGHIEIRQLAGVGAMGRVYRAFQKGIERDVAVKILHRELSANQQLVQRFHREAKVASRLQHPNVVQVHLAGQLPDGALYIVMEYLDGLSLQSALAAAGGAMPLSRAMRVALQLCDATGEAHAQGVVHRDLKPENVMLVRRGDDPDYVKVLDFGIARLNWGDQSMATAAGLIFGTARYISPEGAQGEQVGPASDVYGIATLLFQMLAGRTPFEGDQAVALLVQQIHDAPPDLRALGRAGYVPEAIAQAIMKNLAKSPGQRDPDARAFGRALLDAAKDSGMSADELILRSGLLSGRQSGAMQLPPMQRTKQLELSPELSERLAQTPEPAGSAPAIAREPTPTPPPSPSPSPSPGVAPYFPAPGGTQSAPTTKWTPPPGFSALLSPPPRPPLPSDPKGPEETLDDEAAPIVPAPPSSEPIRPVRVSPALASTAPATMPEPPPTAPRMQPTVPQYVPATLTAPGATISKPDPEHDDEDARRAPRRRRSRAAVLVLFCFLFGAAIAVVFGFRAGVIGARAAAGSLDDQVTRAQEALKHKRWDAPPGDNVKDLTTDGLARWPADARLIDVRERASDELVKEALGRKFGGDLTEALHLARLARELDASDPTAQHLVQELEQAVGQVAPPASTPAPIPLKPPSALVPPRPPPAPAGVRVTLDASTAKPRVGQQVDLVAKIGGPGGGAPKSAPEDPHFVIAGPGGSSTRMPASAEGTGLFRASFTFLEAGKYDITFSAKLDGNAVHAARAVTAGTPGPSPTPSPSGDMPTPPPTSSGKWL
jgi:eukaryotic-like serine/threonine-protein kinase